MNGFIHQDGIQLAREATLLAAQSLVQAAVDRVITIEDGYNDGDEQWDALWSRMQTHEQATQPLRDTYNTRYQLSNIDYWLLCFAAAAEVYPDAAAALSIVAEDERLYLPTALTFARIMQSLSKSSYRRILEQSFNGGRAGTLGLLTIVEPAPGKPVSQSGLRLSADEFSGLLTGVDAVTSSLDIGISREQPADISIYPDTLTQGAASLVDNERFLWLRAFSSRTGKQFALDIASMMAQEIAFFTPQAELPSVTDIARARKGLVAIDLFHQDENQDPPFGWLERVSQVIPNLIVIAPNKVQVSNVNTITVPRFEYQQAKRVWAQASLPQECLQAVSLQFMLTLIELRAALDEATLNKRLVSNDPTITAQALNSETLRKTVLSQGARRMGKLVTVIDSTATLDELVVPTGIKQKLLDVINWRKSSSRVYGEMGVEKGVRLGRGLTCLFSGSSGTGKTFASQCIANELGMNLYRIDLSQVVSKYIGETEKSLAQVFDESEAGHGVLLFDEADALFGKRSEVKDAHDRYANIEVGYLLQRMESFDGVLILATNLRNNIDPAFLRRLQFLVEFPLPDHNMRVQLWKQSLPDQQYLSRQIDIELFAERFRLSGGSIRNIAVAASHLAAAKPTGEVKTDQLAVATFRELEKSGHARTAADFGDLANYLPETTWTASSH